eukprot:scaffold34602_cov72-Phaeocystis_antarctica.AAC.4
MKASSAPSTGERRPSISWVGLAASRMPESKRLRKYPEEAASAARCALNSTPSAQTAMSVSFSLRQREASEEWCASPPNSVILGAAVVAEDEGLAAAAHAADVPSEVERRAQRERGTEQREGREDGEAREACAHAVEHAAEEAVEDAAQHVVQPAVREGHAELARERQQQRAQRGH